MAGASKQTVTRAHQITFLWAKAFYMKLNADKSFALGGVDLFVSGQQLKCISETQILGDLISFDHDLGFLPNMPEARVKTCLSRLARIAHLPGTKEDRLECIGLPAIPTLYGGEFTSLQPEVCAKIRTRIWEAVRSGAGRPMKACMEVLMTVFCKGHVVDPMQFLDYRTMLNFTRLAKFDLQSQQDLREVWSRYKQGEFDFNTCAGPIANLFRILQSINWQWISPWSLVGSSNKTWLLPLPLSDKPGFAHAIREALRQREIARASGPQRLGVRLQPRADMQGVETGVKFAETRKLSMYLSDYDKGLLIAIVSGSFSTMERDFRHIRPVVSLHLFALLAHVQINRFLKLVGVGGGNVQPGNICGHLGFALSVLNWMSFHSVLCNVPLVAAGTMGLLTVGGSTTGRTSFAASS